MVLDRAELDRIVYDVIRDWDALRLTREQIADHVLDRMLDHIKLHILEYVSPSIDRLLANERVIEDRDSSRGRPDIYHLPTGAPRTAATPGQMGATLCPEAREET
jgi:hypothetical protein